MNAKVSVIVPVRNAEELLPGCLDSLVGQSLEEIEIIVVDVGSTDRSPDVADSFAARYSSKICSLALEDGCFAAAMDLGMEHASGEYIGAVRGGDRVARDMYERLYACAVETPAEIVCCTSARVEAGKEIKRYLSKKTDLFGTSALESPELLKYAKTSFWNKICKRDFLIRGGYRFSSGDPDRDAVTGYEVLMDADRIACVNLPLYYWIENRRAGEAQADGGGAAGSAAPEEDGLPQGPETERVGETAGQSGRDRAFGVFERCDGLLAAVRSRTAADGPDALYQMIAGLCVSSISTRLNQLARGRDRRLLRAFTGRAYDYLERNFPDWREHPAFCSAGKGPLTRVRASMLRHRATAELYYGIPWPVKKKLRHAAKKIRHLFKGKKASKKQEKKGGGGNPSCNIELLEWVQHLLRRIGVQSFADFSSLWEIVQRGETLVRLPTAEIGVLAADRQENCRIRRFLEGQGLEVCRQYVFADEVVEETYAMGAGRIVLHYYRTEGTRARTRMPYKLADHVYEEKGQSHLMELTGFSPEALETVSVNGREISVPRNAGQMLEERYGFGWREKRAPVGLETPSVRLLEGVCHRISYKYVGHELLNEEWFQCANRHSLALLKSLHGQYLEMLAIIDRICREHHLTWYLGEGTLLGAMRHHGFIPWDDDVDILMPKEDYDVFIQVAPKEAGKQYVLDHYSVRPKTPWLCARLRLIGDCDFACKNLFKVSNEYGPDIRILPLYTVSQAYGPEQRARKRRLARYRLMLRYKAGILPRKRAHGRWKYLSVLLPASYLHKRAEALLQSFQEEGDYCANYMSGYSIQKQIFPQDYYGTPRYVAFEDMELPVPQKAEEILCAIYGADWDRMPGYEARMAKSGMLHRTEKNRYESIVIR